MRVRVGNTLSDPCTKHEGVTQWSVKWKWSALFAMAINGLPSCTPRYVENSLYVNDFAMFTKSTSLPSEKRRIQLATNALYRWAVRNGFNFSPPKQLVCISQRWEMSFHRWQWRWDHILFPKLPPQNCWGWHWIQNYLGSHIWKTWSTDALKLLIYWNVYLERPGVQTEVDNYISTEHR